MITSLWPWQRNSLRLSEKVSRARGLLLRGVELRAWPYPGGLKNERMNWAWGIFGERQKIVGSHGYRNKKEAVEAGEKVLQEVLQLVAAAERRDT